MEFVKKSNAQVFLLLNSVMWGSSYVWSKVLLSYLPSFSILAVCSFGSLAAVLIFFSKALKTIDSRNIKLCIAISSLAVISNTCCMLALKYTSSSNAAFIFQTSVIITPIIMMFVEKRLPGPQLVLAAIIAFSGLFLLTGNLGSFSFRVGDLFAFGAALFFSLRLAALNMFSNKINAVQYTLVHHSFGSLAFATLALTLELPLINFTNLASPVFAAALTASIFVAAATELFQSRAIVFVKPQKASLLYTAEPLTTAVLAFLIIGERFTSISQVAGCFLIFTAVLISIIEPGRRQVAIK